MLIQIKIQIMFSERLAWRTNSALPCAVLVVCQRYSTQAPWSCGWDSNEMRDVFPLGSFQQNYPFRFMQLFVTSVTGGQTCCTSCIAWWWWLSNHVALEAVGDREVETWKQRLMRWVVRRCYRGTVQRRRSAEDPHSLFEVHSVQHTRGPW